MQRTISRLKATLPTLCLLAGVGAFGTHTAAKAGNPGKAANPASSAKSAANFADRQIVVPQLQAPRSQAAATPVQSAVAIQHAEPASPAQVKQVAYAAPVTKARATNTQPANPMRAQSRVAKSSLLQRAAYDQVIEEVPPRLVKGQTRTAGAVQQVGYQAAGCSCGACAGEPTCGLEPGCGLEPSCGYETAYEVGCGAESCSVVGCDGGCAPSCGSEGFFQEASCGFETSGAGGCDACGDSSCAGACGPDSYNFCLPIFRLQWCRFEFFAGVNGFTGPGNYANTAATSATNPAGNRVGSSSFGFYEGINEGRSLKPIFGLDLAAQLGVRATQTGLSGAEFTDDTRNQVFVTGGFFRRVDFGLQYGVVADYLNDDWWYSTDLVQLRGELSWNDGCSHEYGYQFMAGISDSTSDTSVITATGTRFRSTVTFEPTDQHRFFFRKSVGRGGWYQAFIGGTDSSDGLLGMSMSTAVTRGFALQAGATYLIPNESRADGGNENESWNMSLGFIFRPGGLQACGRYCRPMFDVADNGTFLFDRL